MGYGDTEVRGPSRRVCRCWPGEPSIGSPSATPWALLPARTRGSGRFLTEGLGLGAEH